MSEFLVDIWSQFDEARGEFFALDEETSSSEEDVDEWGVTVFERNHADLQSRVFRLPDGDIHVCDDCCPYATPCIDASGRSNGDYVCVHTGRVVMRCCEERTDMSTGRSTWSVDPDVTAGGPIGGKWRKKRDMKKESKNAFIAARQFNDSEMPEAVDAPAAPRNSKRGALCVDETAPMMAAPKRIRVSKKDVSSIQTRCLLIDEASNTFGRLFGKKPLLISKSDSKPFFDERLLSFDLLFQASVRKYLKEKVAKGCRPSLDDIHNIELAVRAVIEKEKRKIEKTDEKSDFKITGIAFRTAAARLAVALWKGACSTSYLQLARRGSDSFRPFCAGVFYAMKRGLRLADGTVLVPKIEEFTQALPTQRVIAAEPTLKSLHASSHRGLCTIHRVIAAAGDTKTACAVFCEAIKISKSLA